MAFSSLTLLSTRSFWLVVARLNAALGARRCGLMPVRISSSCVTHIRTSSKWSAGMRSKARGSRDLMRWFRLAEDNFISEKWMTRLIPVARFWRVP